MKAGYDSLVGDHDRLQKLHDLLSQDYERLKMETLEMRNKIRSNKVSSDAFLCRLAQIDVRYKLNIGSKRSRSQ